MSLTDLSQGGRCCAERCSSCARPPLSFFYPRGKEGCMQGSLAAAWHGCEGERPSGIIEQPYGIGEQRYRYLPLTAGGAATTQLVELEHALEPAVDACKGPTGGAQ